VKFYYILIFNINENTSSEKEAQKLELEALEYHTRAKATQAGTELENTYKTLINNEEILMAFLTFAVTANLKKLNR
jgi:prolyl-tRNA editing enzyme YbaK/EbsC (Cys-tRNA(Pro) deacylase)